MMITMMMMRLALSLWRVASVALPSANDLAMATMKTERKRERERRSRRRRRKPYQRNKRRSAKYFFLYFLLQLQPLGMGKWARDCDRERDLAEQELSSTYYHT